MEIRKIKRKMLQYFSFDNFNMATIHHTVSIDCFKCFCVDLNSKSECKCECSLMLSIVEVNVVVVDFTFASPFNKSFAFLFRLISNSDIFLLEFYVHHFVVGYLKEHVQANQPNS